MQDGWTATQFRSAFILSDDLNQNGGEKTILPRTIVAGLDGLFGVAAGIVLFLLMVVVTVDVIGRYIFSAPLHGSFEYIQIGMAVLVFLALPAVVARDENVQVEVFQVLIPKPVRRFALIFGFAISVVAVAVLAWVCYLRASSFHASGERFALLPIPLYPIAYFIFAMWAVCVVIMLVQLVRYPRFLRKPENGE